MFQKRKDEAQQWSMDTELLAMIAELLHVQLLAFVNANSRHGAKGSPLHIPRPWEAQEAAERAKPMSFRDFAKTRLGA